MVLYFYERSPYIFLEKRRERLSGPMSYLMRPTRCMDIHQGVQGSRDSAVETSKVEREPFSLVFYVPRSGHLLRTVRDKHKINQATLTRHIGACKPAPMWRVKVPSTSLRAPGPRFFNLKTLFGHNKRRIFQLQTWNILGLWFCYYFKIRNP